MNIKKLCNNATIPTKGTEYSAGYDLYAAQDSLVYSGECSKISTGLSMEIPTNFVGLIFPRSGLATKEGLRLANCVAVIDSDYRGEWFIPIYNDSNDIRRISVGERVAQLVIVPYINVDFVEVDELSNTERGNNGFGSTGK